MTTNATPLPVAKLDKRRPTSVTEEIVDRVYMREVLDQCPDCLKGLLDCTCREEAIEVEPAWYPR